MQTLDTEYINDLTERVKQGSTDAFSELFGTTYEKQFSYAYHILKKRGLAKRALHLTYAKAFREIFTLSRADVFPSWLFMLNFDVCMAILGKANIDETYVSIDNKEYTISNIRKLPMTEACVIIDRYFLKMPIFQIADYLEIGRNNILEQVSFAKQHLIKLLQEDKKHESKGLWSVYAGNPKLDIEEATVILKNVLKEVSKDAVRGGGEAAPEAELKSEQAKDLLSYSIFRRESVGLRASVLIAFTTLFALVPLLFVTPKIKISEPAESIRGLSEVSVRVKTPLPVKSVEAVLHGIKIPVYEVSTHTYTIEPPGTGEVTVYVELFNGQKVLDSFVSKSNDTTPPVFISSSKSDGNIFFYVKDDGVGMDFDSTYVLLENGEKLTSDYYDSVYNYIAFPEFDGSAEIYFFDNFQNFLHIIY